MSERNATGFVGRRIGAYDIKEEIGRGGMGAVYRAHDRSLARDVALKVLLPEFARDAEYEQRFVREARAVARLDHPNIVQVYTAGRAENALYIAMQLVKGKTLGQLQRERGSLWDPMEALRIVRQAAEALEAAHKVGLVHRDIKPTNIMLDESGRVKIMDFGLARSSVSPDRITQAGVFFGTPEYASPEQCETSRIDGRSDIYSLGAVLYEMLTGRVPHLAETALALFKKISQEDASDVTEHNPKVPRPVAAIVRRMLARKIEERYASGAELIEDIDRALQGRPVTRTAGTVGRRRALAGIALVGGLVVAGLMWLAVSTLHGAAPIQVPDSGRLGMLVFDFKNGTQAPEDDWYSIGLSDMLITALGQHGFLAVPTREQLLWKARDLGLGDRVRQEDQRRLVGEFGAGAYVTGTYYVKDRRVRVTATCYRARDNATAFASVGFERPENEVFALVDELAAELTRKLRGATQGSLALGGEEETRPCQELMIAMLEKPVEMRKSMDKAFPAVLEQKEAEAGAPAAKVTNPRAGTPKGVGDPEEARDERLRAQEASLFRITLDPDTVCRWYRLRQMVEQSRCDAEEVKSLLAHLQMQVMPKDRAATQRGLENFRQLVVEVEARKKAGIFKLLKDHVAYVCSACNGAGRPEGGACDRCGGALVIEASLQPAAEKKP